MKRSAILILTLCALALTATMLFATGKAPAPKREKDTFVVTTPVKLLNVVLEKGLYQVVHDSELMAQGKECTEVYSLNDGVPKLVASFHCIPMPRSRAYSFTVRTVRNPDGMDEIQEFQFAGSTEGHQIPAK
jgi:hypothetical protein